MVSKANRMTDGKFGAMMNVSLTNEVTPSSSNALPCSDFATDEYRDPSHLPSTLENLNISYPRCLHKQSPSRAEGLLEALMKDRNRRYLGVGWDPFRCRPLNETERARIHASHV